MSLLSRLFLMLCVFAGLGAGMVHGSLHGAMDHCESHCVSGHGHHSDSHDDHDHDHDHEGGSVPHQHTCCHPPSADRATETISLPTNFQCILVEIATDRSLAPDEPVFALDKPPLI